MSLLYIYIYICHTSPREGGIKGELANVTICCFLILYLVSFVIYTIFYQSFRGLLKFNYNQDKEAMSTPFDGEVQGQCPIQGGLIDIY